MNNSQPTVLILLLSAMIAAPGLATAAQEHLVIDLRNKRISADVQSWTIKKILTRIVSRTGWEIMLEPGTTLSAKPSTRFSNAPLGKAFGRLLPDLNFLLTPQADGPAHLLVFTSQARKATEKLELKTDRIKKHLIVRLKKGSDKTIEEIAADLGGKVVSSIKGTNAYLLEFPYDNAALLARDALLRNEDVAGTDFNYQLSGPSSTSPISLANRPLSIKPGSGPDGTQNIVALIDTPVQRDAANSAFLLDPITIAGNVANLDSGSPTHGTSMFETFLRGLDSVSDEGATTDFRVLPIDVYGDNGATTTFDVAGGIIAATEAGAAIAVMALGSSADSPFLRSIVQQADDAGLTMIASAGNEPTTDNVFPAAFPQVTAVTAGARNGTIADYANRGEFVDIVGPGTSLVEYQDSRFIISGTSPAAAHVAGVVAGMSNVPGATHDSILGALKLQFSPPTTP